MIHELSDIDKFIQNGFEDAISHGLERAIKISSGAFRWRDRMLKKGVKVERCGDGSTIDTRRIYTQRLWDRRKLVRALRDATKDGMEKVGNKRKM